MRCRLGEQEIFSEWKLNKIQKYEALNWTRRESEIEEGSRQRKPNVT